MIPAATSRFMAAMNRAVLAAGAILALALSPVAPKAAHAATALGGAKLDPLNLIDDALENEALAAYARHAARKPFKGDEIVIVDYALPSTAKRLYIVNIRTGAVEPHYVAHGRGSDPGHTRMAVRFSDAETSGMSSVGAYRGLERYRSGTHGPALRLEGLERSNASAYRRLIVFHTAGYFDPANGRFGRSCGCFVVTKDDMTRVYDVIADGGFLYAGPARLNDAAATPSRDCNPECGNICPNAPLLAEAKPARPAAPPPVVVAKAPKPPAVKPEAVTLAALTPEPKAQPKAAAPARLADFRAPVPQAKPAFAAPTLVAASFEAPMPRLKPALDRETIDGEARLAAEEALSRAARPRLVAMAHRAAPVMFAEAPLPQAKPAAVAAHEVAPEIAVAPLVVDVAPGETPVPSAKPAALRQTAGIGGPT